MKHAVLSTSQTSRNSRVKIIIMMMKTKMRRVQKTKTQKTKTTHRIQKTERPVAARGDRAEAARRICGVLSCRQFRCQNQSLPAGAEGGKGDEFGVLPRR